MFEGITVSVIVLAVGSFSVIGASVNAPLLRKSLGLSAVGIGAIASTAYLGALVTAATAGRLTDKKGPTAVLISGLALIALGDVITLLAVNQIMFYAGIFVVGLGYGSVNPPTTVMSNPENRQRRGLVLSIKQSGVPLGGVLAGALLPSVGVALGWRWAFGLTLVVTLAITAAVVGRGGYRNQASPKGLAASGSQGKRLRLPYAYVYGLLMAGVQVSIFGFTAVYLVEARGLSHERAGFGVSIMLIGGVVGRVFWGWLSDVRPMLRIPVLQLTALLGASSIYALLVVPTSGLAIVLFVIGTTGIGWNGVYIAAVAEGAESDRIGSAAGRSLTMVNLGAIVVPLIVGLLVHRYGSWTPGLIFLLVLSLLAGAAVVVFATSELHGTADLERL